MSQTADRNLLFGILALQNDFVTRDQLIEAMNAWVLDKDRPLGDVLRARGVLGEDEHALLEALLARQLTRHDGDGAQSLRALSSVDGDVRALLASLPTANTTQRVDPPAAEAGPHVPQPPSPDPRYRILRQHAKGGLGEVFVAEDTELHREIALKEIQRKHADDADSRARFLMEAEVTGKLEHPGIVPVYGLGRHRDGRPFYAMRFIKGDDLKCAIEQFHRSAEGFDSLAFRQLLRRFLDVCNAVAYAHSRGVLHRDLKPANVMLGKYGETLVVDWGLAKVVGREAAGGAKVAEGEASLRAVLGGSSETVDGTTVGTPSFMSPEQAEGALDALGPATDVYSLGGVLYCLLTNRPPAHGADLGEVLRKVRRGEVPPARQLRADVPRALEAICRKAMALHPAHRYETALALAEDVEHWLADEPVTAHPEAAPARAARWARKHRTFVTAAAAVMLVGLVGLSLGLAVVSGLNRRLDNANQELADSNRRLEAANRDLNDSNAKLAAARTEAEAKRTEAAEERAIAQAINDFLRRDLLQQADTRAQADRGFEATPSLTVREVLDRASAVIGERFRDQPLVEAEIRHALGNAYRGVEEPDMAVTHLERALALRRRHLPPDHPNTLASMSALASAYFLAGRFDRAVQLFEQTREKRAAGPDRADTLAATTDLVLAYLAVDEPQRASALLERTLSKRNARSGTVPQDALTSVHNLASAYRATGKLQQAADLFEQTRQRMKAGLGPSHPGTLALSYNLAAVYFAGDKPEQALPLLEQTLAATAAALGADHPDTLTTLHSLATVYRAAGRPGRALPLYERLLESREAQRGADHPETLQCMTDLALTYRAANQPGRALPLYERLLEIRKARFGADHPDTLGSMHALARLRLEVGEAAEAEPLLIEALDGYRKRTGNMSAATVAAMTDLGDCQVQVEKYRDAEKVLRKRVEQCKQIYPNSPEYFRAQSLLGEVVLLGLEDEWPVKMACGPLAGQAVRQQQRPVREQQFKNAEQQLMAGYRGLKAQPLTLPDREKSLAAACDRLIRLYEAWDKSEDVSRWKIERATLNPARYEE
jgi:serine/threonine protein kinase